MPRVPLPRESSLIMPQVPNPFVHKLNLTWYDKVQIALMSIFVVPIRIFFVAFWLVIGWIIACIALHGRSPEELKKPLTGWRNVLRPAIVFCCRMLFYAGGFHWVTHRGTRVSPAEAPILATAPHSTYFDALVVTYLGLTTVVAKSSADTVPLFGTLLQYTQPVYVSREDPNSRVNTIKEIRTRAQTEGEWPQIVIFPEGTCTNRACLISFKPGAFIPGVPVQPLCLRYSNRMHTTTWTWEGPGAFTILWLTLCNFHTSLEVEFLPPYIPTEAERNDAKLFANNVRLRMGQALGVPVTDHTYEDCRLMSYAAKLNMPAAAGLVEFNKLSRKLGFNFDHVKEHLDKFCQIAHKNTGSITIDELASYLDLPKSEYLEQLFEIYDRSGSGTIDFREWVIGAYLVSRPANSEDTIKLAFKLFDDGDKGHIESAELETMLINTFGMEEEEAKRLFEQVDADQDGKIKFDEFKQYAEEKPEYAPLFMEYQKAHELREAQSAAEAAAKAAEAAKEAAAAAKEAATAAASALFNNIAPTNVNHTDKKED